MENEIMMAINAYVNGINSSDDGEMPLLKDGGDEEFQEEGARPSSLSSPATTPPEEFRQAEK